MTFKDAGSNAFRSTLTMGPAVVDGGGSRCAACEEYLRSLKEWERNPVGDEPINHCHEIPPAKG